MTHPAFMSDAFDDCYGATLDPELDNLCEDAGTPASPLPAICAAVGVTVDAFWSFVLTARAAADMFALKMTSRRVASGYLPKAQRDANEHGLYVLGLKTRPPTDPNLKIKAAARRMGHVC